MVTSTPKFPTSRSIERSGESRCEERGELAWVEVGVDAPNVLTLSTRACQVPAGGELLLVRCRRGTYACSARGFCSLGSDFTSYHFVAFSI